MSIAMAVLIGSLGCFNNIGIYITFVVPVGVEDWTPAGRLADYKYVDEEQDEYSYS